MAGGTASTFTVPANCSACQARHLGFCQNLTSADQFNIDGFKSDELVIQAGDSIYEEGTVGDCMYYLKSGWVILYHLFEDGRRQILEVLLPGAYFGLAPESGAEQAHSAQCLTDVSLSRIHRGEIYELFRQHPELGQRIVRSCARDRIITHQHLSNLGRRTALERIAHFLMEIYCRLERMPGGVRDGYAMLPMTQEQISDALGLTPIHVNRTLRVLQDQGLIETGRGRVLIPYSSMLAEIAGIDADHDHNHAATA